MGYMADDAERETLERDLVRWAEQRRMSDATRNALIIEAVEAGISKHRVHVLTGIARTTIDAILGREPDN